MWRFWFFFILKNFHMVFALLFQGHFFFLSFKLFSSFPSKIQNIITLHIIPCPMPNEIYGFDHFIPIIIFILAFIITTMWEPTTLLGVYNMSLFLFYGYTYIWIFKYIDLFSKNSWKLYKVIWTSIQYLCIGEMEMLMLGVCLLIEGCAIFSY